jgi:hypothetical protein
MWWYTGELSGSVVDVNQYFEDNYNQYLGDWNVWNVQHTINEQINQNSFNHSDWNVLLNNVSKSVDSRYRQKIEYFYGTTSSITYPAELQDSYLSLRSYNTSRYDGSKTTSLLLNTYTSASYTGSDGFTIQNGDKSFGKTAAIDHNVRKIGLFTRIDNSVYLSKRNNVALKYLVDEFGGLTELNQFNKNWHEIQNTFIAGDNTTIALFDNKKFGNQKFTDGIKLIFDSGYSYYPILYYPGSGSNNLDLYFENIGGTNAYLGRASSYNNLGNYFISGATSPGFPLRTTGSIRYAQKFFNEITQGNQYMTGSATSAGQEFTVYNVPETGQYTINGTFDFDLTLLDLPPQSQSWAFQVWKSGSSGMQLLYEDAKTFIAGDPPTSTLTFQTYYNGTFTYTLSNPINSTSLTISSANVQSYLDNPCTTLGGSAYQQTNAVFNPGDSIAYGYGTVTPCDIGIIKDNSITVNGNVLTNGSTIQITPTTLLTISIDHTSCLACS